MGNIQDFSKIVREVAADAVERVAVVSSSSPLLREAMYGKNATKTMPFYWIEAMGQSLASTVWAVASLVVNVALLVINFIPSFFTREDTAGDLLGDRIKTIVANAIAIPNGIIGFFVPPLAGAIAEGALRAIY